MPCMFKDSLSLLGRIEEVLDKTRDTCSGSETNVGSKHEQISLKWIRVNYKQQVHLIFDHDELLHGALLMPIGA